GGGATLPGWPFRANQRNGDDPAKWIGTSRKGRETWPKRNPASGRGFATAETITRRCRGAGWPRLWDRLLRRRGPSFQALPGLTQGMPFVKYSHRIQYV